jgi:hypothetical protein
VNEIPLRTLIAAISVASLGAGAQAQTFSQVSAKAADSFVDSIGINVHITYDRSNYGKFSQIFQPALLGLGVRHARDGAMTWSGINANTYVYSEMRELSPIKFDLITNPSLSTAILQQLPTWTNGAIESYEGINEPDLQGDPNWVSQTRNWQSVISDLVSNTPALSSLAVLAPSPAYGDKTLGSLAGAVQFGNSHPYPGGGQPLSTLAANVANCAYVSGSLPIVVTETGYTNAVQETGGQTPASELATSKYIPRLLLGMFHAGIAKTYIYELLDEGPGDPLTESEDSFGLVRQDGSLKPAYVAVRNLISLLSDPGPAFNTGTISYTLSGAAPDTDTVLLEKRDGSYWLAIWQEVSSWNTTTRTDVTVSPTPVRLTFGFPVSTAQLYQPNSSSKPVQSFNGPSSIALSLNDEVQLVRIVPSAPGNH